MNIHHLKSTNEAGDSRSLLCSFNLCVLYNGALLLYKRIHCLHNTSTILCYTFSIDDPSFAGMEPSRA